MARLFPKIRNCLTAGWLNLLMHETASHSLKIIEPHQMNTKVTNPVLQVNLIPSLNTGKSWKIQPYTWISVGVYWQRQGINSWQLGVSHLQICQDKPEKIGILLLLCRHDSSTKHHFSVISCYIMLYHVISCYIMLYHVISCYIMLYHVISCYLFFCFYPQ